MRPGLLAFVGLAACSWVDPDPDWAARRARLADAPALAAAQGSATAATTAGATAALRGFDPPAAADRVAKGDRILYGIEFEKRGARREWLVEVEVEDAELEPREKRDGSIHHMLRLAVRVTDEAGVEVGRDTVLVSRNDLVFGLFGACRGDELPPAEGDGAFPGRIPVAVRAGLALGNMLRVIRGSDVLFDVLLAVVDKPSIFSVIRHLGVRASLRAFFDDAIELAPIRAGGQSFRAYELAVELRLNGVPALRSKLLVGEPNSPLNLSAGILGIDAFQPSDPDARVSIRVLAARRAAAGER